jgi:RNA polymerase sigma factor (sigma-70 family)
VTVDTTDVLAERFEANRGRLRAVAYRMLGSTGEADDAVQEAWLRLSRAESDDIDNLSAWLTTVVARVSLDMLRSRKSRREEPLEPHVPEPIISSDDGDSPENEVLLADSVGLALQVVLETRSPAERLAFVLHDMFAVPFDRIAAILDRSPAAARQLASRARRRVRGTPPPDTDLEQQREVVDAFLAAAREGDFEALLEVLDPDVVLRVDGGEVRASATAEIRGAAAVVERAKGFRGGGKFARRALVNGAPGIVVLPQKRAIAVAGFTIAEGRIVEIDVLADPERLRDLDLSALVPPGR